MKIAYLTAGAAGMFCGSCMHDNTLAAALCRQGAEALLVPTYTPIRTDENDVSVDQVFFGGINIYLQQKVPFFRYLPRFLDRVLDSPWLIRRVTKKATSMDMRELGALTVSMLKGKEGYQRKEVRRLCDWLKNDLRPDVVLLTNILIGGGIPEIRRVLNVPVVVTLQGDDIFLESLPEPYRSQALSEIAKLVPHVDRFLTHSHFYADFMSEYLAIPREKIDVIALGLDTRDFASLDHLQHPGSRPFTVGYLARLAPEKGLAVLVDAFIRLKQLPHHAASQLLIAGWLGATQEAFAQQQFELLDQAGLKGSWKYAGAVDRDGKVEFLKQIDLLCVPTTYREPKGLFALEALASGVPVVLPSHGAFPEMLAAVGGGVLTQPFDAEGLAMSLDRLSHDRQHLRELGAQGRAKVLALRNADLMGIQTQEWLENLISASNRS